MSDQFKKTETYHKLKRYQMVRKQIDKTEGASTDI